jgi:hypothetical protein
MTRRTLGSMRRATRESRCVARSRINASFASSTCCRRIKSLMLLSPHDLARQGVDQPRLPPRQLEGATNGLLRPVLSGGAGVLEEEVADVREGEVIEGEGGDLDVEGAGGAEAVGVAAAVDLVVADVAQAAEDDGVREGVGAVGKT